ncbi:hypothetical protein K8089_04990 [Aequorivita sp. F47161]|uniref:STAS/SEC14 domain-containing protein n=1 Tax=Aequorivita vitellina TaxID=2874475 RepID=A0A9X1U132_9FLAO|nr:hypothetical protein [Aequorivita vitellina]MCG2418370.1 hypothetical protein [Aequorivita vitellina]
MEKNAPHNLPSEFKLEKVWHTEIGTVYFYGTLVVVEAKEGIIISHKNGLSSLLKGLAFLGTKPWVYISNRVQSYSVKPTDYKYLNRVPTLKAMVVVAYSEIARSNAELESKFCKKPFAVFETLYEAVLWSKTFTK